MNDDNIRQRDVSSVFSFCYVPFRLIRSIIALLIPVIHES